MKKFLLLVSTVISLGTQAQNGWQNINHPLDTNETLGQIKFLNPQVGFINIGKSGFLKTTDGGANWTELNPFPGQLFENLSNPSVGMSWVDENHGWKITNKGTLDSILSAHVVYTHDGGTTWNNIKVDSSGRMAFSIDFVSTKTGWANTVSRTLGVNFIKTTDGGATWNVLPNDNIVMFDFVDSLNGWAITNWGTPSVINWSVEKTSDGGSTWTRIYTDGRTNVEELGYIKAINATTCWVEAPGNKLIRTTDSGLTWDSVTKPNYYTNYNHKFFDAVDADHIWVTEDNDTDNSTECKVHHSRDGGQTWELQHSGISNGSLFTVHFIDANNGWLVCESELGNSGGMFFKAQIRKTANGGATGLASKTDISNAISVFPNPSTNGLFTIQSNYTIHKITCYDIYGKLCFVKNMNDENEMKLDLSHQPEGIYFIHLQSEKGESVKKVVIQK